MKKLLLIDGNSILNRAFFGIRSLSTKDGRPTNAIYGLMNVIGRELHSLSPDYAVIAFDLHAPTFRKQMYEPYKANRHGMPDELHAQLADAKECAELLGMHRIELEGYEADDILGTVSAMAEREGDIHSYILTGDRDLLQLISPNVTVLLAGNAETLAYDRDVFFARYGVEPSQLTEVKGLMGDSSDNIPGVPGVGEKTALKLISQFGTIEQVYASLDAPDITRGLRAKLESGQESAYLSRRLATILREVPLAKSLADLSYRGMQQDALREKLLSLEFTGLIRKFGLDAPLAPAHEATNSEGATLSADADSFLYIYGDAEHILTEARTEGRVGICLLDGALYLATAAGKYRLGEDLSAYAPLFDGSIRLVCYDAKHLHHFLHGRGIRLGGVPRDLMLYAYCIDASFGTQTPAELVTAYLHETLPEGLPYAHLLTRLEPILAAEVEKAGATALLVEIELPLAILLAEMEETGFAIAREGLAGFRDELERAMNLLTEQIYAQAGEVFNINSPKQLSYILFEKLGLHPDKNAKKTKTGYSTNVEVLTALKYAHPVVESILDYRQISKLYATYAVGLLKVADEEGRVHTDFKQALTATGRLSSAEPNLQNIPIRTELGREMRRYFVPKNENYVLVDADYSQIELRVLAHIAQDESMIAAFASGADIHTSTAATVFGLAPEEVTPDLRARAKAVNFGIVYGIGAFSLANDLGISTAQAKDYITSYLAAFPRVADYMQNTVEQAREQGYTRTMYGRKRSIPELHATNRVTQKFGERIAMNSPIQGTAADIIKIAMLRVARRLKKEGLDARLVMQVHDELVLEAARAEADEAARILREEMEAAADLAVPLTVDTKIGENWLK